MGIILNNYFSPVKIGVYLQSKSFECLWRLEKLTLHVYYVFTSLIYSDFHPTLILLDILSQFDDEETETKRDKVTAPVHITNQWQS